MSNIEASRADDLLSPFYHRSYSCRLSLSDGRAKVAITSDAPEDDQDEELFEIGEFLEMAPDDAKEALGARLHDLFAQALGGKGGDAPSA